MFERQEQYAVPLIIAGAVIAVIGLLWLIRRGFKEGRAWGAAAAVPPLQLVFWWKKPGVATPPWLVILLGVGITVALQRVSRIIV